MSTAPPFKFWANDLWLILPPGSPVPDAALAGNTYNISRSADNDRLMALFYNGNFLISPLHYAMTGRTITLNFNTVIGDNLYAAYMATTYS